jgi:hypothetical protein
MSEAAGFGKSQSRWVFDGIWYSRGTASGLVCETAPLGTFVRLAVLDVWCDSE